MASVNQILSKALSTPSEDEAIVCLRMARRKFKADATEQHTSNDKSSAAKIGELEAMVNLRNKLLKHEIDRNANYRHEIRQLKNKLDAAETHLFLAYCVGAFVVAVIMVTISFIV